MDWTSFLTPAQAERIAKLESNDIVAILRLTGMSQKAEDILRIAQSIRDGQVVMIPDSALSSGPKTLYIIACSWVRDKNQYSKTYGVSDGRAAELASLLHTNPDAACEQIKRIVSMRLEMKGSGKEVEVLLTQGPASKSTVTTAQEGDGGAKELAAEIAKRPDIYGLYKFDPEESGATGQMRYRVHLGDDLFVLGQSRKVVIAAARICRVKGRFDGMIKPYVWYWTSWSSPLPENEIPDSVWNGKQSAMASTKPRKEMGGEVQQTKEEHGEVDEMMVEDID